MKIVVDGMAETYRQYYAMRLNSSVNIQTGAIFGFLRSMLSYTNQFGKKPCIAWEGGDL